MVRLQAPGSLFLVMADGYHRRGRFIDMKARADAAVAAGRSIETVIVVNNTHSDTTQLAAHEHDWDALMVSTPAGGREPACEKASDGQLLLTYTSGTSGKPKGTVHIHAGLLLKAALDLGICMDLGERESLFWITDIGWLTAPRPAEGS